MKALLLAAGTGTRLRPLTDTTPKCLVPILGTPLLEYWLKLLSEGGVGPSLINTHHLHSQVKAYLDRSPFREGVSTVYEEKLLGTAGTLLNNRAFFADGPLMCIHADNLSSFSVGDFIDRHRRRPPECVITMMTFHTAAPRSCGIVQLDNRGVVQGFFEKEANPPGNLANGAVYIMEPSIFSFLESRRQENLDLSTDVIPHFLGRLFTFHNGVYHRDIGTPESYRSAQKEFAALQGPIKGDPMKDLTVDSSRRCRDHGT